MMEFAHQAREHIMVVCIMAIIGLAIFAGIYQMIKTKFSPVGRAVVIGIMAYCCYISFPFAAEKRQRVNFLQTDPEIAYLIDTGSYVTNNAVHLEFETRLLPGSAMLYLDYIPADEPADSDNFSTAMSGPLSEFPNPVTLEFENATSNRWIFYTTYTPGPNVHTNGVAVAEFLRAPNSHHIAIPKRSTIWEGEKMIYPDTETFNRSLLQESGEEGVE